MIKVKSFEFNPVSENTYVLSDETKEAVIIDAGCFEKDETDELDEYIALNDLRVIALLNTHSHFDHVLGNFHVKKKYKCPLFIFKEDLSTLLSVKAYAPNIGFWGYQEVEPDGFLHLDKPFRFGNSMLNIAHTPGHAPGHIVFYSTEEKIAITGDNIILNTIGRTDLPGGDLKILIKSIEEVIFSWDDDMRIYPGHGLDSTVGYEKKHNTALKQLL
ncbi:MAG TPA: MBL fold metallo-hydrolase [Cytophagales bacterium]|nr:MBL fold metallo-hydrolase [Cytophagales bacterium]